MHKYQNVSGVDQAVIGVGVVKAGGEIEVEGLLDNPNFELVGNTPVTGVAHAQPNGVTEAKPQPELEV